MEMGPIDLLHIAGHASLNVNHPAFSYVHFSDGNLRAFEIMGSELQVETVVLSACDSGRMSLVNLFEPDGITRSFLAKGSKQVLSAMWALDDRAGSQFMNSFYGKYLHKTNLVQAVNNAKLDVRKEFAHPYYWGAMSVFGGMKS
jgi:CHAT domain-containing protein